MLFQSLERVLLLFYSSADLLGVDETVAEADIGYFYGAVSVGGESRGHSFCCFWHLDCKRNRTQSLEQYICQEVVTQQVK